MKFSNIRGLLAYLVAVILMVVGFIMPPTGEISSSVLFASSIILAGHQLIFGKSIKSIRITKEGLEIENFEEQNNN